MSSLFAYPANKLILPPLIDKTVDLDSGFTEEFEECCFIIKIYSEKVDEHYEIVLEVSPISGSKYELIADYAILVQKETRFMEKDFWTKTEVLQRILTIEKNVRIVFSVAVHQPLIAENVMEKTTFRYYRILCAGDTFYVNPANLKKYNCEMFDKWYNDEVSHEECSIVQELAPDDLKLLLMACCAYSTIVVHSKNFYELAEIGVNLKIVSVVRSIDAFVMELKTMHVIRKLECCLNYRLTLTADGILKSLRGHLVKLESLHDYLAQNGENERDLPMDLLAMLDIYDDYVII